MENKNSTPTPCKNEEKSYWARICGTYRFLFWALLFVLPVFVIVFMALCAGSFTRNSVFGFGKDVGAISSFLSSDYATVSYTYREGEHTVLSYHDGVAAVTTGGIEIYSPNGARLLNVELTLTAPRAVCSQKYLLVYDFGARSFVVTSAYGVLFTGETDFPIYGADVADTGHFALITASDTHLSQVLLYDANFNLIQRFQRDSATTAVTVSDNGKYVAMGGVTAENGDAVGLVEMYRVGIKNSAFRSVLNEVVLDVDFTDDRHLAVLGAGSLRVMDLDGDWDGIVMLEGETVSAYDVGENGCALVLGTDPLRRESRVVICDEKGNILYDGMQKGEIRAICVAADHAFWLTDAHLTRFSLKTGACDVVQTPEGASGLFAASEGAVRVFCAGEARYVEFE